MKFDIKEARRDPWEFFSKNSIKDVLRTSHPDFTRTDSSATFAEFQDLYNQSLKSPEKILDYEVLREIETGDLRRVCLTRCGNVLKIPRVKLKSADSLIKKELSIIKELKQQNHYGKFVPDCVNLSYNGVTVLNKKNNLVSLSRLNMSLPDIHIGWILKRCLDILGYVHHIGYGHCAITPEHILVGVEDHSISLCGLIHHKKLGESIEIVPSSRKNWYTSKKSSKRLDLSMLSATIESVAENLNPKLRRFLKGISISEDSWECHDQLDSLLKEIHGKPKFHKLVLEN